MLISLVLSLVISLVIICLYIDRIIQETRHIKNLKTIHDEKEAKIHISRYIEHIYGSGLK